MHCLNVLIIEDSSLVALELAQLISSLNHKVVEYATNIEMAQQFFKEYDLDLILMDINLNDKMNGIELYKSFHTNIPVIYLTAYRDDETILKAIDTDPLGYLIKPYKSEELSALLQLAIHKIEKNRTKKEKSQKYIILGYGYLLDRSEDKLFFNNRQIKLTPKELELLKLLIKNRGKTISFKTIESNIWNDEVVSNSSIRTLIYRLRSKFEENLIKSEFNQGIYIGYLCNS